MNLITNFPKSGQMTFYLDDGSSVVIKPGVHIVELVGSDGVVDEERLGVVKEVTPTGLLIVQWDGHEGPSHAVVTKYTRIINDPLVEEAPAVDPAPDTPTPSPTPTDGGVKTSNATTRKKSKSANAAQ